MHADNVIRVVTPCSTRPIWWLTGASSRLVENTPALNVAFVARALVVAGRDRAVVRLPDGGQVECRLTGIESLELGDPAGRTVVGIRVAPDVIAGQRYYALCPFCERAVRLVYRPHGVGRWACRQCHGLRYASAFATRRKRAAIRAGRLRERLGGHAVSFAPPLKPRGMSWIAFERRAEEIRRLERSVWGGA
jgi:ribosomal protein L37AE/L43A